MTQYSTPQRDDLTTNRLGRWVDEQVTLRIITAVQESTHLQNDGQEPLLVAGINVQNRNLSYIHPSNHDE